MTGTDKTAEYKALTPEEAADLMLTIERPIICMHRNPDGDTAGTAMALATVFRMLGRQVRFACCDPIPERLRFIFGDEELSDYEEGLEAVSVDVASRGQLGGLKEVIPDFVLMIDHHATGEPYAPYYTVPDISSASEAMMDILNVMIGRGDITLTEQLALHLYTAISSDTGGFCYSNTTPATHRLAARLLETGIDAAYVNHMLFHSKSRLQLRAESMVAAGIRTACGGRLAYATLSREERDGEGIPLEYFETAIDIVRSVRGAEIAFIIKETDTGDYKTSIRSRSITVSDVAERLRGGGHLLAAGCTPLADSIEEAAEIVKRELERKLS